MRNFTKMKRRKCLYISNFFTAATCIAYNLGALVYNFLKWVDVEMGWVGVPRFVGAFGTSESGASVNYGYQGNRYAGKFLTAPNY